MRLYLDTSALVKLYVDEEGSSLVRRSAVFASWDRSLERVAEAVGMDSLR